VGGREPNTIARRPKGITVAGNKGKDRGHQSDYFDHRASDCFRWRWRLLLEPQRHIDLQRTSNARHTADLPAVRVNARCRVIGDPGVFVSLGKTVSRRKGMALALEGRSNLDNHSRTQQRRARRPWPDRLGTIRLATQPGLAIFVRLELMSL
jgi:hypothetical protein